MAFRDFLKRTAKKFHYADDSIGPQIQKRPKVGVREWIDTGKTVNVRSSWVFRIQYVKNARELIVTFRDGFTGHYRNVSDNTAAQLFMSNSIGSYVKNKLRSEYVGYHS